MTIGLKSMTQKEMEKLKQNDERELARTTEPDRKALSLLPRKPNVIFAKNPSMFRC